MVVYILRCIYLGITSIPWYLGDAACEMLDRMTTRFDGLTLPNPGICGGGAPEMSRAGNHAPQAAGPAGVPSGGRSAHDRPEPARHLDLSDCVTPDIGGGRSPFNRSD